jgi:plasmid maintenance system antidote protein VapI
MAAKKREPRPRTKTVPDAMAAAFREELRRYIDREFESQSEAGEKLGIDQSHISALLSGKRGVGLPVLLLLRERTGRSVDEWLGLHPTLDSVRAVVRDELSRGSR